MIDFYLHDDPVQAAQLIKPSLHSLAIIQTAQILSAIWCKYDSERLTLDWKRASLPLPEMGAWQYVGIGEQRIYGQYTWGGDCDGVRWGSGYGGNYDWLYKFAVELCGLYKGLSKTHKAHMLQPVIRTLELCPPTLLDSLGTYSDYKDLT